MARIAGVDIPRNKRVEISLTYIFGIGKSTLNKILEKDYSSDKIEDFDYAVKLNGTRMFKIPNDDKIANIFKAVPYIDDIILRYDPDTKKSYVYVASYYYRLSWDFDIEPKLNDKNKIVIKNML
mgnify:CR=1 FL=1